MQTGSRIDQVVQAAARALGRGDQALARRLLSRATEMDPTREDVWLWLAAAAESPRDALSCFRVILALNPANQKARKGLLWFQAQMTAPAAEPICLVCGSVLAARDKACPACGHVQEPAVLARVPFSPHDSGELAPGFALSVEQAEAIDACLERVVNDSGARYVILADIAGRFIGERGNTRHLDTQVLSALAAGELVATYEMARLVGEGRQFRLLLQEGEKQSVYLSDVSEQLILVVVFDSSTPIGLVRIVLKQAVEDLISVVEQGVRPGAVALTGGASIARFGDSEEKGQEWTSRGG